MQQPACWGGGGGDSRLDLLRLLLCLLWSRSASSQLSLRTLFSALSILCCAMRCLKQTATMPGAVCFSLHFAFAHPCHTTFLLCCVLQFALCIRAPLPHDVSPVLCASVCTLHSRTPATQRFSFAVCFNLHFTIAHPCHMTFLLCCAFLRWMHVQKSTTPVAM